MSLFTGDNMVIIKMINSLKSLVVTDRVFRPEEFGFDFQPFEVFRES